MTTGQFFGKLRQNRFSIYINPTGAPVIRDETGKRRDLPDDLMEYAKINRSVIIAFLENTSVVRVEQPVDCDDAPDEQCRQCKALVFRDNIADGDGVATCFMGDSCPFQSPAILIDPPWEFSEEQKKSAREYLAKIIEAKNYVAPLATKRKKVKQLGFEVS